MITAIVTQTGKNIPTVIQQQLGILTEEHTKLLATEHKKELDNAIDATRERSLKTTGNHLKDQIQVEKISSGEQVGYGVGNIEVLNQKAPWWAWINFGRAQSGRTIPPPSIGSFSNMPIPDSGAKGGTWLYKIHGFGGKMYKLNPKKAIKAHNYIEKSLGVMISKVRELLK
jgi:hypothetical protein